MSIELQEAAPAHPRTDAAPAGTLPAGFANLLGELLADQQRLQTPAALAATAYERAAGSTAAAPGFRRLIPLSAPAPGEQYAFEVDFDRCSGCKACVAGCHSLNGLDEEETWRDVGLLIGGEADRPWQQTVTTACHHCADPGCLNGCPVLAYEKDPLTGIVRHLDDQCIGCQYCILKCPYDVPKYNERLGIVRKCDMCHQRLAAGEAPACVQACPTEAIRIVTVRVDEPPADPALTPGAPASHWTRPTTRYRTRHPIPANAGAADARALRVQHAHWPLVFMLVLTQMSVGALAAFVSAPTPPLPDLLQPATWTARPFLFLAIAIAAAGLGLGASVLHLGQPLRAWRVFLNLRRSWLSREAVVFGGYAGLLAAAPLAANAGHPGLMGPAAALALAVGLVGIACSIMIYADTPRRFWRLPWSAGRMLGTTAVTALALLHPPAAILTLAAKLGLELTTLRGASASARLQRGPLLPLVAARLAAAALAAAALLSALPWLALIPLAAGELLERALFFKAVDPSKMPGVSPQ